MRNRSISALAVAATLAFAACSGTAATPVPTVAAPTAVPATPTAVPATPTAVAATPTATLVTVTAAPTASPVAVITPEPTVAVTPTAAPTDTPVPTASPSLVSAACMAGTVATKNTGRLTLSTDNPAYPPWWGGDPTVQYPNEPAGGDGWELSDPYANMGYEDATAYAIAAALGFAPDHVDWIIHDGAFETVFAPGPKPFDFHMAQVSINAARAKTVDLSDSYFDANQSVLAMTKLRDGSPNPILSVTTIEGLKAFKLGAAVGTTSLGLIETVIKPDTDPQVISDNTVALRLLKNHQVDGLVVDLNSAFYMRDAQLENFDTPDPEATIVGQFDVSAQVDQIGAVLEKGSSFTACVDQAIAQIKADGTLQGVYDQWISGNQNVPVFQ